MQSIIHSHGNDFYTGEAGLKSGYKIYFGFEEILDSNFAYWSRYEEEATIFAENASVFCDSLGRKDSDCSIDFPKYFCLTKKDYRKVVQFFKKKKYHKRDLFFDMDDGFAGMQQVLKVSNATTKVFIAYASAAPVIQRHDNNSEYLEREVDSGSAEVFRELYDEIVMSVIVITDRDTPTTTHYGIFRNPWDFFDVTESFRGLSMVLHGFAATISLSKFPQKKYMITNPVDTMFDIFKAKMSNGLYMGDNTDLAETDKKKEWIEKFPPIYHVDQVSGVHKIAVSPEAVRANPISLPEEVTAYEEMPGQRFDHSGFTRDAVRVVASLRELAKFYIQY